MTFLFLGEGTPAKDQKISELRDKFLSKPQSRQFDYELLHGAKLEPAVLKKALMNLPAIAPKRLIVIRECHKLVPQNQEILVQFLEKSFDHAVLVLDSDDWNMKDSFVKKVRRMVEVVEFSARQEINIFNLSSAIEARREVDALKILDQILESGIHPLQVLGVLVWFWGKSRSRLSKEKFESGLLALQEADLNIKRSRLRPEYSIELLVVKLLNLMEPYRPSGSSIR